MYCQRCFSSRYFLCADCGNVASRDDTQRNDRGQPICYDCWSAISRWRETEFHSSANTFIKTHSERCFGVELETADCPNHIRLRGHTCFGAKEDGSISGLEFISPILQGDKGLAEIRKFCRLAHQNHFEVDDECGFHVHIDLRESTSLQRRHLAYAYRLTIELWQKLVDPDRLRNCFCRPPDYEAETVLNAASFDTFARHLTRYEFINWRAWGSHKTVEIRGYQGTLRGPEICNWIVAHLRFVDFVKDKTFARIRNMFRDERRAKRTMRQILGPRLARYYAQFWRVPHNRRTLADVSMAGRGL